MTQSNTFLKIIGGCLVSGLALAGCADAGQDDGDEGDTTGLDGVPEIALPEGHAVVGEYVLHVRPRIHQATLERIQRRTTPDTAGVPGLEPQDESTISINSDGVTGSGPANTIELVTSNVVFGAGTFSGDVKLNSFYTRTLNGAYVQVTGIQDSSGNDVSSTHGAISPDADPSSPATSVLGGSANIGLWRYPQSSGFIGASGAGNSATRTWTFADDGTDTNIYLRAVAPSTYKNYSKGTSPGAVTALNACTMGGAGSASSGNLTATVLFPFTFFNKQPSSGLMAIKFNRDAVAAFGGDTPPGPSSPNPTFNYTAISAGLPDATAAAGLFPFWDHLNYNNNAGSVGKMCSITTGTAPNRQFVVTWQDMRGFGNGSGSNRLNVSAVLTEGIDTIDFVYPLDITCSNPVSTVCPPTTDPGFNNTISFTQRGQGVKATVGIQGNGGSGLISGGGAAAMGATTIVAGMGIRYTPIP